MNPDPSKPVQKEISLLLMQLRRRIRQYVWMEGLSLLLFHLGILFWISLGIDRFFEPSISIRIILWSVVIFLAAINIWRTLLRYLFTPLYNHSLAIILERRFPQLNDALLTMLEHAETYKDLLQEEHISSISLNEKNEDLDPEFSEQALREIMLQKTREELMAVLPTLKIQDVFNFNPLRKAIFLSLIAACSVVIFFVQAPEMADVYRKRIFQLSDIQYPRQTILELEGFKDGKIRIARGSDLEIRLRAGYKKIKMQENTSSGKELRAVYLYSRNAEGIKNRVAMVREGRTTTEAGEMSDFHHTFRSVLVPMTLDIYAGDTRIRNLQVEVVDSPILGNMMLEVEYPRYMSLEKRMLPATGIISLPAGTNVHVHATANKPLKEVEIIKMVEGENAPPIIFPLKKENATTFSWEIGRFVQDTTFHFILKDQDGLTSRAPTRLSLVREEDQLPNVAVQPYGIGSAITVNAKLPVKGKIMDDHGIRNISFDFRVERTLPDIHAESALKDNPQSPIDFSGTRPSYKTIQDYTGNPTEISLTGEAPAVLEVETLKLMLRDKLQISVVAEDRYDLDAEYASPPSSDNSPPTPGIKNTARLGRSQPVTLEVVTPERLRLLLEAREITLRQLYEAVYQEVLDSRDSLQRIILSDWKKQTSEEEIQEELPEHQQALQSYRVERVIQNDRKNLHEILGIAEGVENICMQMLNNRIDTPTWLERLQKGVQKPLEKIANDDFHQLELTLTQLRRAIDANQLAESQRLHQEALRKIDSIILEMDAILAKMTEMQDFTEMVEILREIIRAQEEVNEQTKKYHREDLRDLEL
ncbi:MAG: hypothetical protein Q4C96_08325 [Planctomycetia bacterium]|nr:hypothetical protein [Planctomycetia bacterium]